MLRIKLWMGIGAFVFAQTSNVAVREQGLNLSFGPTPALAGENGEGDDENGEEGEGESERGEGDERDEGYRRDAPRSEPPRRATSDEGRK